MSMKHRDLAGLLLIISLLVAACGGQSKPAAPPAAAQPSAQSPAPSAPAGQTAPREPIKIAGLFSLTTGASIEGISQKNGTAMAVDEVNAKGGVNGRKIELLVEDVGNSPATSVNALNRVLEQKPAAIMGPLWGTHLLAYEPIIRQHGVPILAPSGTRRVTQQGNPWYFRYFPHDGIAKVAQVKFAVEKLGKKKPALLYVTTEYGQSGRDVILATLKQYKIEPVAVESINPTDKDATAQIKKIKDSGADVLLTQQHSADLAIVLKAAKQMGLNITHVSGSAGSQPATMNLLTGQDVAGLYVETAAIPAYDTDPAIKAWAQKYKEKFNAVPDAFALLNYDATMMLLKAIEQAGAEREAIRKALATMEYKGLVTTYKADKEGNQIHQSIIIKYDDNKVPAVVDRLSVPRSD